VAGTPREVAELADALDRASAQVRDAGEERALMLAGVSHDLRTPLTRLQYALELIPDADPALRAGMERDIEEMDAVLGQFVAYARDGRDEHAEPLDLADLCRNAATALPGDWTLDLPDSAPMRGRPMALLRAVGNLMANAGRHGRPPFVLSLRREGRHWLLEIADHGPGLSAEAAARVRQPFVRSGTAAGSGLGLAIVERVAHQRRHAGAAAELAARPARRDRAARGLNCPLPPPPGSDHARSRPPLPPACRHRLAGHRLHPRRGGRPGPGLARWPPAQAPGRTPERRHHHAAGAGRHAGAARHRLWPGPEAAPGCLPAGTGA
jgi:hypothetical protein